MSGAMRPIMRKTPASDGAPRANGKRRLDAIRARLVRDADPMGHRSKSEPERVAPVVAGRNDPCPCGSGAKVKRCPHPDGFELREPVDA